MRARPLGALLAALLLAGACSSSPSDDAAPASVPADPSTTTPALVDGLPAIVPLDCYGGDDGACAPWFEIGDRIYEAYCDGAWIRPDRVGDTALARALAGAPYGPTEARRLAGFGEDVALAGRCGTDRWEPMVAVDAGTGRQATLDLEMLCPTLVAGLSRIGCVERDDVDRLAEDEELVVGEARMATLRAPDLATGCDLNWIVGLDGHSWRTDDQFAEIAWRAWLHGLGAADVRTVESADLVVELRSSDELLVSALAGDPRDGGHRVQVYRATEDTPPCP